MLRQPMLACAFLLLVAGLVLADRPAQKKDDATNIVIGKVASVVSKEDQAANVTSYIVEVQVDAIVRGKEIPVDQPVKVHCFQSSGGPDSSGHTRIPKKGETVRVFLVKGAGGNFEMIYPDGVEVYPGPLEK